MREIGLDISAERSKSVDEFRDATFDLVITVCDDAAEECPTWLDAGKRIHIGFPDTAKGSLDDFRAVRDDLARKIIAFLDAWESNQSK